jgi:Deoxyribonuclease NucA/NucB
MPDVSVTCGETRAAARRLRVPRNVAVILGCLLIGIIFSVVIPASASASISSISMSAGPPAVCPGAPALGRENLCYDVPVHILIVAHLFQRETFDYDLQIEMSLSNKSTALQFGVSTVHITEKGNAPDLVPTLRISMTCGSCLVNSQNVATGSLKSIHGSATNAVPISPWQEIWPQLAFYQRAYAGGSLSNSWSQPFTRAIRCDHWYPTNWTSPGCVFPAYVPSVDMSALSTIAKNIRLVQSRGIHIGQPGSGRPLHRNTGPQEADNNRSISCPESVPRPAGYQCDEYPFASSFEGGAAMSPPNRISAWVPATENNTQGQKLRNFYRTNRLIQGSPGDAYYVYAG